MNPVVMSIGAGELKAWLTNSEVRTRLRLVYGAVAVGPGTEQAWADRQILWTRFVLDAPLPETILQDLLEIPDRLPGDSWILDALPFEDREPSRVWRTRSAQGLRDALAFLWAEEVHRAMAAGRSIDAVDAAIRIRPGSAHPDESRTAMDPELLEDPARESGPAGTSERLRRFAEIHNVLLRPADPFAYLDALGAPSDDPIVGEWVAAATAGGAPSNLREAAGRAMDEALRTPVPPVETPREPDPTGLFRQVAGVAAASGRVRAAIWNPRRRSEAPEKPFVLVADGWSTELAGHVAGAAALVETRGGRGGPGAMLARRQGIPAVAEAPGARFLRDGAMATVDGDTGIITLDGVVP